MDLFTHFLVPYIILFFAKSKDKLAGGLGGISIDFDFFIVGIGFLIPELFIFTHRGITHSFVFGFITAVIFMYIFTREPVQKWIGNLIKRDLNLKFTCKTVLLAYFGVLTHLLLDYLTTGGIPLFYPFSLSKYSAYLYNYIDVFTMVIAILVIVIIYIRIDVKYKKIAMMLFMIMLFVFGGVRAYEKMNTISSMETSLTGDFSQINTYPTANTFVWKVVLTDPKNSKYQLYEYDTLNGQKTFHGSYNATNIKNGTYKSAMVAISSANKLVEVQKFRWNAFYTCVNATYHDDKWQIIYFDFLGNHYQPNNLTVYVDLPQ
jgi:inner membrane protein